MRKKKTSAAQPKEALLRLGRNIATMRNAKGFSQEELSDILKVHPITISDWETGQHEPKSFTLQKIAAALSCSMEDLLSSNPPHPREKEEVASA